MKEFLHSTLYWGDPSMLLHVVIIHRFSFLYNIFSVNIVHYFQLLRHLGSFQFGTMMNSGAKTMSFGEYVCNQIGVYSYLCLIMLPKMLIEILDLCVFVLCTIVTIPCLCQPSKGDHWRNHISTWQSPICIYGCNCLKGLSKAKVVT